MKLNYIKLKLIGLLLITPLYANSEYRVYQYSIKSKFYNGEDNKAYIVTSTLDPVSYSSYNGGKTSISLELLRTWMCKGNTSNTQLCDSPYDSFMNATKDNEQ